MHTDLKALTTNSANEKYYLLGMAVLDKARSLELIDPIEIVVDEEQMTIVWCGVEGDEMEVTVSFDGSIKWATDNYAELGIDLSPEFEQLLQVMFPNPHLYD